MHSKFSIFRKIRVFVLSWIRTPDLVWLRDVFVVHIAYLEFGLWFPCLLIRINAIWSWVILQVSRFDIGRCELVRIDRCSLVRLFRHDDIDRCPVQTIDRYYLLSTMLTFFSSWFQMSTSETTARNREIRSKRRFDETSSSTNPQRPPWPRTENTPFDVSGYDDPKAAINSNECRHRPMSDNWDDYDSLFI